jgi:pimeloyl-ACP methyl ester carboxylesterase
MKTLPPFEQVEAAGISFLVRPGDVDRTVVLLHGIGGHASGFSAMMRHWPTGPRLLAWDCPGYGASQPILAERPAPSDYARALAVALDELDVASISIMGQSLGALLAGAFATLFPNRVRSIVLMCPALGYRTLADSPLPDGLARRVTDFETEGASAFAEARASRLVHEPRRKPDVVETVRNSMAAISVAAHTQAVHALAQGDLIAAAASWRNRVLVLAGADDVITPRPGTERLFDTLRARPRNPGIREHLRIISDAGHAVFLEHPAEVAAVASTFIAGAA